MFGSRGDGTLELESSSPVGDRPMGAAIGDFDGDGVLDVAVINFGSDDVSILLGAGAGRFMPQVRYPVRDQPLSIAAADLDLDGAIDLMVADNAGAPPTVGAGVTVMMGDGEGGFGRRDPGIVTRLSDTPREYGPGPRWGARSRPPASVDERPLDPSRGGRWHLPAGRKNAHRTGAVVARGRRRRRRRPARSGDRERRHQCVPGSPCCCTVSARVRLVRGAPDSGGRWSARRRPPPAARCGRLPHLASVLVR